MRQVFADSVFLIGKLDARDPHHDSALAVEATLGDAQIVTTDIVLSEVLAFVRGKQRLRAHAVRLVRALIEDPNVVVINLNADLFERGLNRYARRPRSAYSLVDCISMEVMDDLGITEVLTADRDFELEGFSRLMRNPREARGE